MKRTSDPKDLNRFRSDRFFVVDGKWYFTTREGSNEGPFASSEEAVAALRQYLMDQGIRVTGNEPWDIPGASN
jgi:Domain of unknown function (DUF6316)